MPRNIKGCVFSPVYLPLASCTSVPSPSHLKSSCLATQWLNVKLRGLPLQEPYCSYALCFQDCLFIGPGRSVTPCRDSVWGSVRTRPLIVLYPSLACPSQSPVTGAGSEPSAGAQTEPASLAEGTLGSGLPRGSCAFLLRQGTRAWSSFHSTGNRELAFAEHLDSVPGSLHVWLQSHTNTLLKAATLPSGGLAVSV